MKPKTEEFLYFLLYSAEKLMQPTFRNLDSSFESWAYRNGLMRQLGRLEQNRLIEQDPAASPNNRLYRLTAQGRLHVLGGRDPQAQWSRYWDGHWRLVLYDVPSTQNTHRIRLRRYLLDKGFGYLQKSVWITPDSVEAERKIMAGGETHVGSLMLMTARPCAGETDEKIVAEAWDFEFINNQYEQYLKILAKRPGGNIRGTEAGQRLQRWAAAERSAWLAAVQLDPMLPEKILPKGYLGKKAWQERTSVLPEIGRKLNNFTL